MKLTLSQIVNAFPSLQRLGAEKMPIRLAYVFQRNMRMMTPDMKQFEEKRIELVKTKYGTQDENTNWTVTPEKRDEFQAELETLSSVELDLDIRTVNMDEVMFSIAPNDLFNLEWMFVETPKLEPKEPRKRHG